MRKIALLLTIIVFCSECVIAQRDTVIAYMSNSNAAPWQPFKAKIVGSKDSADFIRMVTSPDISVSKTLFPVNEYYLNGNPKLQGNSNTGFIEAQFEGPCIEFFPNGKKKCICNYEKGRLSGNVIKYFPNGKIYLSGVYKKDTLIVARCSDSTGRVLVEDGNGTLVLYSDNFKYIIGSGPVKDGLKDAAWKGILNDTISYEATYKNGKVITGISNAKSGNKYQFNKEYTLPEFIGGLDKFGIYLAKTIIYPSFARDHNIQGKALISFYVDRQGDLHNIHSVLGNEILATEAVRVMRLSPRWQPATSYGIAMDAVHSVPISFTMATEYY